MSNAVEGFWKNYKFELCPPIATSTTVIEQVCQHMRENYMKDGVLYKYLNWSQDTIPHSDIIVQRILAQGLSFLVRDMNTGEIVAVQISCDSRLGSASEWIPNLCPKLRAVNDFVRILEEETLAAFRRLLPVEADIENFAEIYYSSVSRKHRRNGLCTEMYRRTLPFLRSKGFAAIRNTFTDPATVVIGQKLGFVELGRAYLTDGKDPNGVKLFPEAREDEYCTEAAVVF